MDFKEFETKTEQLCGIIIKTDSEFWETRNKAIQTMTAMLSQLQTSENIAEPLENHHNNHIINADFSEVFRMLKEPIKLLISDLRSQQVRDCCTYLIKLAQITGDKMKIFLRDSFVHILEGVKVPNKVMSGYVDECILQIIKVTVFKSAIPILVNEVKDSKAKVVRERCLDYLNECFIHWDLTDKDCDLLVDPVKIGLEDASVRAREIARTLYLNVFMQFPKKTEKIKSAVSKPLQSKLSQYENEHQPDHGLLLSKPNGEDDLHSSIDQSTTTTHHAHTSKHNNELSNPSKKSNADHDMTTTIKKTSSIAITNKQTPLYSQQYNTSTTTTTTPMPPIPPIEEIEVPLAKLSVTRSSSEELAALSIQATVRGAMTRRRSVIRNPFEQIASISIDTKENIEISDNVENFKYVVKEQDLRTLSGSPTSKSTTISKMPLGLNMRVTVSRGKEGKATAIVRYIGETQFASGVWVGVELHKPLGKNNGTVQGHFYFQCAANHGLFVKEEHIEQCHGNAELSSLARRSKLSHDENDGRLSPVKPEANRSVSPTKIRSSSPKKQSPVKDYQNHPYNDNNYNYNNTDIIDNSDNIVDNNKNTTDTTTEGGQPKSNKFTALLKLKLSQLMDLLNQQLEIVVELENEHDKKINHNNEDDNKKGTEANAKMLELRDEVIAITQQELELLESFRKRLFLTEI